MKKNLVGDKVTASEKGGFASKTGFYADGSGRA